MQGVEVRYDSAAHDIAEPVLSCAGLDERGIPLATTEALQDFISAWAAVDPNGTWNPRGVVVEHGVLVYEDECGRSEYEPFTEDLFALDPTQGVPWWITELN